MSDQEEGPSEIVQFNVGHGKGIINADELVNTSAIPLAQSKIVMLDGKDKTCGYYSNSSLGTYIRCAKKFEYQYILKEKSRKLPTLPMWAGIAVHDGNDALLTSILEGDPLTLEDYLTHIQDELDEMLDEYEAKFDAAVKKGKDPEPLVYSSTQAHREGFSRIVREAASTYYAYAVASKP